MSSASMRVRGLREFERGLDLYADAAEDTVADVLAGTVDTVADDIRRHVPYRTGRARASVKVTDMAGEATVAVGGPSAPYFPWLDFGGPTGRKGSVRRRYVRGGRYFFPAYERAEEDIVPAVEQALGRAADRVGLD